jgi:excisionase family DNA binding protein
MTKEPLTIQEAAELLTVSERTIRRMLDAGQLAEASRDSRNRIYITPESLDAAAVALGRKKASREEVREIAPTLNSQSAALETAINTFSEMVRERDQRIYELQHDVARLEAERRYLPLQTARVEQLERELAEALAEIERMRAALGMTPGQVTEQAPAPTLWRRIRRKLGQ